MSTYWVLSSFLGAGLFQISPFCLYRQGRHLLPSFLISFLSLILLQGTAHSAGVASCPVPGDYGEVVCRYNEKSPNQLYIVGIGHRDTLTGSNGPLTSRIQAEVYKIAEWLIKNQGVELLLPEGFFVESRERTAEKRVQTRFLPASPGEMSIEVLEKRFSDERTFMNAEMLLRKNFSLLIKQVEDRDIYRTVYENICLLVESGGNMEKNFLIRSELDYHQKRRVGAMLQKIPGIVNEQFLGGHIDNKKALFTIGLSHISDIIKYLEEKNITVFSPLFTPVKHEDYIEGLNLLKEDFGISVIVPRTLIDAHETMGKNKSKIF